MCGILGIVGGAANASMAERMAEGLLEMEKRGPDASGFEVISAGLTKVCLGHVRLSIIDLSADGNQPMHSLCGNFVISYNGEIYNYEALREELEGLGCQFKTNSDTEVLLNAWSQWGTECLLRLRGMFAFAVLEIKTNKLYIVRDGFGIKPLYFSLENGEFIFSSSIAALVSASASKPRPNYDVIESYLIDGIYDYGNETFYENINRLTPGHFIECSLSNREQFKIIQWKERGIDQTTNLAFKDAVNEVRKSFLDSIKLHCLSDVPIGVALSGGIDSSAIACAVKYVNPELECITFSYISPNSGQSEEKWIDIVTKYTGQKNIKISFTKDEMRRDLDDFVRSQGEPVGTASIYAQYQVMKKAKNYGIKVMLEGQGADEVLGGYFGYPSAMIADFVCERKPLDLIKYLYYACKGPNLTIKQMALSALKVAMPRIGQFYKNRMYKNNQSWISISGQYRPKHTSGKRGEKKSNRNLYREMLGILKNGGLECLLRHGDRNAMAFSIENRVPFLDEVFVSPLFGYPNFYHVSKIGRTKNLFREAIREFVPEKIVDRLDKIGFEGPEDDLLSEYDISELECTTLISLVKNIKYKTPDEVKIAFNLEKNPRVKWRILNIAKWGIQNFKG